MKIEKFQKIHPEYIVFENDTYKSTAKSKDTYLLINLFNNNYYTVSTDIYKYFIVFETPSEADDESTRSETALKDIKFNEMIKNKIVYFSRGDEE